MLDISIHKQARSEFPSSQQTLQVFGQSDLTYWDEQVPLFRLHQFFWSSQTGTLGPVEFIKI